jgi:hypothetical protein
MHLWQNQEGVRRQDQLERFSAKREHNQHTIVHYHIIHLSKSYYNLVSRIRYIKRFKVKITLQRLIRVCESDFSHGQDIPFALKGNAIHQHSKPGDPSTEFNPRRFGLSTGNPRRHYRQEEAVPHLHTEDSKSKAWATTLSKTYPRWSKDHL